MAVINFRKKISFTRPYSNRKDPQGEYFITRHFESDRGRIINSAAIRRLQQKTQVFPLERNAAVRSRLTHSLEVQQTGRYISKEILQTLKMQGGLAKYGLDDLEGAFESLVEMACLLHDVGNPPFGHFGEAAINDWFEDNLPAELVDPLVAGVESEEQRQSFDQMNAMIRQDLCHFEGNAQAIRMVHTLLQLNLSYSQVACILKYTAPAWWQGEKPAEFSVLMKKPGFYLSEREYISELRAATHLTEHHRFPLTYIMEAADDISYCIADLDDAVEKAIFNVDSLYEFLSKAWGPINNNDAFSRTVGEAWREAGSKKRRSRSDQFFMSLRVNVQNVLVTYAVKRFIDNLPAIFDGNFNHALLEDGGEEGRLLQIFKTVARQQVFNHSEVEQLELQGYRVIKGLLEIYQPLMMLNYEDFTTLINEDFLRNHPIETRLFHKLSGKHRKAYLYKMRTLVVEHKYERLLWERYYRFRLIQDYISGMTDLYAWDEYRRLMAVE
ncbi:deoxyguanosinetriphosphate triphosphohydrolase [Pantoea ananatis]|uniref:dGTPase n=1 Tax=Pantoea ananas TaxID=553 RepID=UPI00073611EA|nr:dGTPase [Pantoea ananatis]KTR50214.1 deoxyguanosinetriphosphate triphosphohydrolase [Pantoea ananatis]KTR56704.1 deoxyguanosinetriphosphate triphosphohydrolase [Pantoea ananatis]KTR66920.1 deoxyguanosinetriphosphate triphosphohydrolase [Pantoea ananatis]KTR71860.1 deoxyguanosinetriphosphate triphosphohydrolase [Pantoea ananatis]MDS7719521.1 dGTPase [Pantoea ananatis]